MGYSISDVHDRATRLRDDLNFILEMLEGAIKEFPEVELDESVSDYDKDWPPCSAYPCKFSDASFSDAADAVDHRSDTVVVLLRALQTAIKIDPEDDKEYVVSAIPEKVESSGGGD